MLANCHDASFVDQHDPVGQRDRAGTVRDDDRGSPCHHGAHGIADFVFFARVDCARRIVQHQHAGVGDDCASNRHTLTLPAAQRETTLTDRSVVPFGKSHDEVVGAGESRRALHRFHVGIGFRKRNVVADRIVEQERLLEHHTDVLSQLAHVEPTQIDAIQCDAALLHVVKAQQQPNDGALAGSSGTHQRDRLPWRNGHTHSVEHLVVIPVTKHHVFERHRANGVRRVSSR